MSDFRCFYFFMFCIFVGYGGERELRDDEGGLGSGGFFVFFFVGFKSGGLGFGGLWREMNIVKKVGWVRFIYVTW